MAKAEVKKLSEREMLQSYPIKGKPEGWYFRAKETSSNAWLVEASDVWGRKIAIQGGDREALLAAAEKQASSINKSAGNE